VCIGAGLSGLTLAHKLKHEYALGNSVDFTIYEKNSDIGGTWFNNVYPGAAWYVSDDGLMRKVHND
jgi:cation diffusion facilitator CzcD-associated flavoprotein CzcO